MLPFTTRGVGRPGVPCAWRGAGEEITIGNGEPRPSGRRWIAAALSALLILTLVALVARARSRGPVSVDDLGGASWGPKLVTLEEIPERAQFRPLMPAAVPDGLRFAGAQIVWVQQDLDDLRLRARQAVRLVYRGRQRGTGASITEAEHLAGVEARDNTWQMISQGYFEADQGMHSLLTLGTKQGVDFLMVSSGLSQEAVGKLKESLAPMEVGYRESGIENR